MKVKRFVKSLINMILFIVNIILLCFNIRSVGELATKIKVGHTRKEKLMYGLNSFIQWWSYICIAGLALTIYWWSQEKSSIAEKLSELTANMDDSKKVNQNTSTAQNTDSSANSYPTATPTTVNSSANTFKDTTNYK